MMASLERVACVQGPTASGKSALAERLACELDGEIVSADSMQVYRGMDIGTAKVPVSERSVVYHCLDLVDPGTPYSAALFQRDARAAIDAIRARGKMAILCGGTGLYVRSVLDEMCFAPGDASDPVRHEYEMLADRIGAHGLHAMLAERDPASARLIHPHNVRRVIRALEMLEKGESYAQRKAAFRTVPPHFESVRLALDVSRDLLYGRIDARVDQMFDEGLVDEVKDLLDRGFRDGITAPQAIGYKEVAAALDGEIALDEARALIKRSSRRYAKRQMTWLRGDQGIIWLHADQGITDTLVRQALDVIEGACGT